MDRGHTVPRQELSMEQRVSMASLAPSDKTEVRVGRVNTTKEEISSLERRLRSRQCEAAGGGGTQRCSRRHRKSN